MKVTTRTPARCVAAEVDRPTAVAANFTDNVVEDRIRLAARHLYDAECAAHFAHQSHVDAWILAAADKLHIAIAEHLAAVAAS